MPRLPLLAALAVLQTALLVTGAATVLAEQDSAPRVVDVPQAVVLPTAAPEPTVVPPSPAARPPAPRAKPRPTAVPTKPAVVRPKPIAVSKPATKPVSAEELMWQAIRRIPGYQPGLVTWEMTSRYGSWGIAALGANEVFISPSVPANRMYDVVVHEWSHHVSLRPYPSVVVAKAAMTAYFGGTSVTGAERAADCMARVLGATWTNYTPCTNASWQAGARRLLAGQPL